MRIHAVARAFLSSGNDWVIAVAAAGKEAEHAELCEIEVYLPRFRVECVVRRSPRPTQICVGIP
jgi:hypothetical protein